MNNINFFSDYLVASLSLAVPLAFAALGGMYSERSGVLNIALEGMLITGAFSSAAATFYTDTALPAAMRYILKAESYDRRGARGKLYCIIAGSAVTLGLVLFVR